MIFLAFPPSVPGGSPNEIVEGLMALFNLGKWITRAGGLVAFAGAIKTVMAVRTEDEKEVISGAFVMVSGFMICEAVTNLKLFNIPSSYSSVAASNTFKSLLNFIGKWSGRAGGLGCFVGGLQLALAMKDNNANSKVLALKGLGTGAMVVAVSGLLYTFV